VDFDGTQAQSALVQADAERWTTVAVYPLPHEAHLARLRLEAEGMRCVLEGEHMSGLAWPTTAGVRVRVAAWQVEAACAVLEACEPRRGSADWVTGELDATRCPDCGSLRVREARVEPGGDARWRVLGVPVPFLRRHASCRHCGHRWVPA